MHFRNAIACIELHARKIGVALHADTRLRLVGLCEADHHTFVFLDHKVVIISSDELQLFIIRIDVLPDRFLGGEVKCGACNRTKLSCRDRLSVDDRRILVTAHPEDGILHGSAGVPAEVEIRVIGHIADRVGVTFSRITDAQCIIVCQGVGAGPDEVSGIPLPQIGILNGKCDAVIRSELHLGLTAAEDVGTAVKVVVVIIDRKLVCLAVQFESCKTDAVSGSSDPRSQESSVLQIFFRCIISEHDILHHLVLILEQ